MDLSSTLLNIFEELGVNVTLGLWVSRLVGLLIVWTAVIILVRFLSSWLQGLDKRVDGFAIQDRDLKTLDRLLDYLIILVGILISLAILGWTSLLYSALTAAGLFSVIIGFAVKDVAANFISGVFILIDRPFVPGDYIELGSFAGTVREVSLRTTELVTLDGPVVFIPNSVVAVEPTINYSVAADRRISLTIALAHEVDVGRAKEIIERVLDREEGLSIGRSKTVLTTDVREYAVDISVYCYAPPDSWLEVASDLRQKLVAALQEGGIELAVPTRKYLGPVPSDTLTEQDSQTNPG